MAIRMVLNMRHVRTHYKLVSLVVILGVFYIVHSFISGGDSTLQSRYGITVAQARALMLTIAIPYVGVWFTALFGYVQFRAYARSIRQSEDGQGFWQLSTGLLWLTLWMPLSAVLGIIANWVAEQYPSLANTAQYTNNYLSIILLLLAFYSLNEGAKKILRLTAAKVYRVIPKILMIAFLLLAGVYIYLTLNNPAAASGTAHDRLPNWAIMDTIVLPRLIGWFLGLQAVWYLFLYTKFISGRIYRLALSYLTNGLGVVILGIILLRCLSTMSTIVSGGLQAILGAIYILLVIISAGYMLVARGGRELARIEQV
jgi:hypothetical protein